MKRIHIATLAAAGLALSACSGGGNEGEQPTAQTNVANMTPIESEAAPGVPTEAPAAPRIDNANTESQPAETTLSPDEQTQEDADATGMTARVTRDEGGNEAQPAE